MSAPLASDTFLCALHRQPTDYTLLQLIRQAGHYLPGYNATRAWVGSFPGSIRLLTYATEVMLQPLDRYPLDAVTPFSGILTVSDAMGLRLLFAQGEGPRSVKPVRTETDVAVPSAPDMSFLQYVFDAVTGTRHVLVQDGRQRMPLIGFSGSSWMPACYMAGGGGSNDSRTVKSMFYARPDLMHHTLEIGVQTVIDYLNVQTDAGAQAVQVLDTWSGALADNIYQQFSLAYMACVVNGIRAGADDQRVSVILPTKDGGLWLKAMTETGTDTLDVDWTVNLQLVRQRAAGRVALQGSLDPMVLFVEPGVVHTQACRVLEGYVVRGSSDGHIFNLGRGTSQFIPPEAVSVLINEVHSFSRALRTKAKPHG